MGRQLIILGFILTPLVGIGQVDTLNQIDEDGLMQGHWIYYGKDRPESGYPENGKIEEGTYLNDRKEGIWIKYYPDGVTPRLKVEYHNNRPNGSFWKYDINGSEKESGEFDYSQFKKSQLVRGNHSGVHDLPRDSVTQRDKSPTIQGCVVGSGFKEDGYNKVFNDKGELWQEGEFKDKQLWNGKLYEYDDDGILLRIKIYKNGEYHSEGEL